MSKFKKGDIVIGTNDDYSFTTKGWIGRVVQTREHTVALVDIYGQDTTPYIVVPEDFELYPQAETRLWRLLHGIDNTL